MIYCCTYTFSIFCTFNRSNAFKMKNDNRVCRSGGIRRIFDKPPPRLLKIVVVRFLQLRRYNCFPILRSLPSFCACSRIRSDLSFNLSIILNHMLSVKFSLYIIESNRSQFDSSALFDIVSITSPSLSTISTILSV